MNIKNKFIKWFESKSPQSYKTWYGNNLESKLNEINDVYKQSFNSELFNIDLNDIEKNIFEINKNLNKRFNVKDHSFAIYNQKAQNGIPQAIIGKWFIRFIRNYNEIHIYSNDSTKNIEHIENNVNNNSNNYFSLEKDLQNSLISQTESLFKDFQIFGNNGEGIEYNINGKKIDLLMVNTNNNEILAIELKAGKADFKTFGQISMYLQLLEEKFNNKNISGIIIANEIDETLKIASRRDSKIKLIEYKIELKINDIQKDENN